MNQFLENLIEIFDSASNQMTEKEFQRFANSVIQMLRDDYEVKDNEKKG